jgi:anaphase-promoting complex subunit 10
LETFWQSDGPIPHTINVQFQKKTRVSHVAIYLDSKTDESYTPQTICFRGGIVPQFLQEIKTVTLSNPQGWIVVPLYSSSNDKNAQEGIYIFFL